MNASPTSTMKRFWTTAATVQEDDAWAIALDAKPLRIPGGTPLRLRSRTLAEAVAAEWQQAGSTKAGRLSMDDVPLTRLAGTAQDRVAPARDAVATSLACYAESDLLCYRAAHPEALVLRQAQEWQPWLDWLHDTIGARLEAREGVTFQPQPPSALAAIAEVYAQQSPEALAALGIAVPALGSAVLGLALLRGAMDAAEASHVATLDERFQTEQWGEDSEASARRAAAAADVALAERFLRLSAGP